MLSASLCLTTVYCHCRNKEATKLTLETTKQRSRAQQQQQPPPQEGYGYGCNFVVHDDESVFFFSRIVGTELCRAPVLVSPKTLRAFGLWKS